VPKVEVDEDELVASRKLTSLVSAMMKNPKAKLKLQEAVKEHDPSYVTPELDSQRAVQEPIDELRKELAAERKAREDEKAERERNDKLRALDGQVEAGFAKLRSEGYMQPGLDEVRKIMDEKGILDPLIAAAYWEKLHPPPTVVTPVGAIGSWNFTDTSDGSDDVKKLLETQGRSEPLADKMAMAALADVRNQRR